MSSKNTKSVLARLKIVRAVKSDSDLAALLNISPQTLSSWKINDRVPYAICIETAEETGVSLEWLLTGTGPMRHGCEDGVMVPTQVATSPQEEAILALYRSLNESDRREIQSAAEEKKRIRDIEQRLEDLTAALEDVKKHA